MNRHERLKRLEAKRAQSSPVKVFVLGCDEKVPEYEGRKFVTHLAYTKAEMMERKRNGKQD